MEKKKNVQYLNDKKVVLDNFKKYEQAEDGKTKKVDGELEIESFHLYEGGKEKDNH